MLRINKSEIDKMVLVFLDHQGNKKALTKEELFKEFFGEKYDESNPTKQYGNRAKWIYLRRMMKWMRKKSAYFVVNRRMADGFRYCLVKDEEDGRYFNDHLESIVKGIRHVQTRYHSYLKDSTVKLIQKKKLKKRVLQ